VARGYIHQTIDLITNGRTYAHVHHRKDAAAQTMPGARHRAIGHEWYQRYELEWNHSDPFPQSAREIIQKLNAACGPDVAEERMSSDSHDFIDRIWDELSREHRLHREGFFAWLVFHPELLEQWAAVDVIGGRIKRTVNGDEVWEDCPEVIGEYRVLRREVSRHHKNRLRHVLARFG
jgi:hypothetical protein